MVRRNTAISSHPRRRRARGFTLLEVLLVVFLLSLLAVAAWPAMHARLSSSQLPESADRFRSLMYLSRAHAMMEQRRVRIRFELGEQHPFVEVEPDPIFQPGRFVLIEEDWALEPAILEGVHVHSVIPGRPAYLTPVSTSGEELVDDPIGAESTSDLGEGQAQENLEIQKAESTALDEKTDEKRPNLIFEPDGSTDWATVVFAEVPSSEELTDNHRQYWVVLDGRTGLAKVTEGITEDRLASAEFTIAREKLILPRKNDVTDQTLNITSDLAGGAGGMFGAQGGIGGKGMMGEASGGGKSQGQEIPQTPQLPQTPPPNSAEQQTGDAMAELEKQLANSDLSEEEKAEIRKTFQQNQQPSGGQ
ncbi:MAG: prepilin-type N-terminal cleavage/methylation domain-containing protein [Planctomycetes bacterium]|nr:prepilin-type N-terminal cleavage/methylation domain-containing protein [Planctomycetota bacterium]